MTLAGPLQPPEYLRCDCTVDSAEPSTINYTQVRGATDAASVAAHAADADAGLDWESRAAEHGGGAGADQAVTDPAGNYVVWHVPGRLACARAIGLGPVRMPASAVHALGGEDGRSLRGTVASAGVRRLLLPERRG